MRRLSHSTLAKVGGASALLMAGMAVKTTAQPAPATVTPQPTERVRQPRNNRGGNGRAFNNVNRPQNEPLIANFEAMFGRKLTEEETTKLKAAAAERDKAIRAARDNWTKEFVQITGITETQLQQKQRERRGVANPRGNRGRAGNPAGVFGGAPAAPAQQ